MSIQALTPANRDLFIRRISAIQSSAQRKWGRLEPAGVLAHLTCMLELSLGEIEAEDRSTFLTREVVRRIVFHTPLPWPKGKVKAPAMFTPAPKGDLDSERQRLIKTLDRFLEESEREPLRKTRHPFFGWLTLKYWQHAHGIHCNHHFEQFGV